MDPGCVTVVSEYSVSKFLNIIRFLVWNLNVLEIVLDLFLLWVSKDVDVLMAGKTKGATHQAALEHPLYARCYRKRRKHQHKGLATESGDGGSRSEETDTRNTQRLWTPWRFTDEEQNERLWWREWFETKVKKWVILQVVLPRNHCLSIGHLWQRNQPKKIPRSEGFQNGVGKHSRLLWVAYDLWRLLWPAQLRLRH